MSWEHRTDGWERYESFIRALRVAGISVREEKKEQAFVRGWDGNCGCCCEEDSSCLECTQKQRLRLARFHTISGEPMVVEEYLKVDDQDCDGQSLIAIAVYLEGQRPKLETEVLLPR